MRDPRTLRLLLALGLALGLASSLPAGGARAQSDEPEPEPAPAPAAGGGEAPAPGDALPAGHPPVGEDGGGDDGAGEADDGDDGDGEGDDAPATGDPHGGAAGRGGEMPMPQPPPSSARPDSSLPAGTVRVEITDVAGRPLAGEHVELGTLGASMGMQAGARRSGTTRDDGTFEWRGLPTGSDQAYRAAVTYRGARFGAEPFQLPPAVGYRVRITRTDITRSGTKVIVFTGRTSIDVRDERFIVVQQMQLVNFGEETWVLPGRGVHIDLPAGFTAFQTEPSMSDLRATPDETGVVLSGSMTPGEARVVWQYHVPLSGDRLELRTSMPFRTVIYEVLVEAAEGMTAEAEGFPEMQEFEDQGHRILGARLSRRPSSPPFEELVVHLAGIPGPGSGRWIAALLAAVLGVAGIGLALRPPVTNVASRRAVIDREKTALLAQIELLEEGRASGEIGPKTYDRRRAEILGELASLLREAQALGKTARA